MSFGQDLGFNRARWPESRRPDLPLRSNLAQAEDFAVRPLVQGDLRNSAGLQRVRSLSVAALGLAWKNLQFWSNLFFLQKWFIRGLFFVYFRAFSNKRQSNFTAN